MGQLGRMQTQRMQHAGEAGETWQLLKIRGKERVRQKEV